MAAPTYVRFQSSTPDRLGRRIGIFGLVNMLSNRKLLTTDEEHFRRTTNAWYHSNFVNPINVDPTVYNPDINPQAAAWFVSTAEHLTEPIPGYLAIPARTTFLASVIPPQTPAGSSTKILTKSSSSPAKPRRPIHQRQPCGYRQSREADRIAIGRRSILSATKLITP
jgi:hypothetical protein